MGTRTGNPEWKDGSAGGTPINAEALNNIEEAIDQIPIGYTFNEISDKPEFYRPALVAGANITIDRTVPDAPVISAATGGGGGGGGNAFFAYWGGTSWSTRPTTVTPVIFISTNDAAAPRSTEMQVGDMWIQHPLALGLS